ncbi:unnamed protein product [Prorocentrum cordatum]|uniref:PARP n=1 Tax=Prorocentrum cordatum TaxID=2364126 RepID=A0ABN9R1Z8_9DINO|nr:unnamed protein product [Polarella glacialis]
MIWAEGPDFFCLPVSPEARGAPLPVVLDYGCSIFLNMGEPECIWDYEPAGPPRDGGAGPPAPRVRHHATGERPLAVHGCGGNGRWFLADVYRELIPPRSAVAIIPDRVCDVGQLWDNVIRSANLKHMAHILPDAAENSERRTQLLINFPGTRGDDGGIAPGADDGLALPIADIGALDDRVAVEGLPGGLPDLEDAGGDVGDPALNHKLADHKSNYPYKRLDRGTRAWFDYWGGDIAKPEAKIDLLAIAIHGRNEAVGIEWRRQRCRRFMHSRSVQVPRRCLSPPAGAASASGGTAAGAHFERRLRRDWSLKVLADSGSRHRSQASSSQLSVIPAARQRSLSETACDCLPSEALQLISERRAGRKRSLHCSMLAEREESTVLDDAEYEPGGPVYTTLSVFRGAAPDDLTSPASRVWNGSYDFVNANFAHLRARFAGWRDVVKRLVSLSSRGARQGDAGRFHGACRRVFRELSSTIQRKDVVGVTGKKAALPDSKAEFLCLFANRCLCSRRGRLAVTVLNGIHKCMKDAHRSKELRLQLVRSEIVVLLCAWPEVRDGGGKLAALDPGAIPSECLWVHVAHVLQKPWETMRAMAAIVRMLTMTTIRMNPSMVNLRPSSAAAWRRRERARDASNGFLSRGAARALDCVLRGAPLQARGAEAAREGAADVQSRRARGGCASEMPAAPPISAAAGQGCHPRAAARRIPAMAPSAPQCLGAARWARLKVYMGAPLRKGATPGLRMRCIGLASLNVFKVRGHTLRLQLQVAGLSENMRGELRFSIPAEIEIVPKAPGASAAAGASQSASAAAGASQAPQEAALGASPGADRASPCAAAAVTDCGAASAERRPERGDGEGHEDFIFKICAMRGLGAKACGKAGTSTPTKHPGSKKGLELVQPLSAAGLESFPGQCMGNPSDERERADCGNTLNNAPKHEQYDCKQWGGYQIQWKKEGKHWKVLLPSGPLCWNCGPTARAFCQHGSPSQIAMKCNEVSEFDNEFCDAMVGLKVPATKVFFPSDVARTQATFVRASKRKRGLSPEEYKVKGWKLSLVDNPDGPTSKMQVVVMADSKELREANIGIAIEYGIERLTSESEYKVLAQTQLYAKQAKSVFADMIKASGLEDPAYKRARLATLTAEDCTATLPDKKGDDDGAEDGGLDEGGDGKEAAQVEDGHDVPAQRQDIGYWAKLNAKDWAFVHTCVPCAFDDYVADENETAVSMASTAANLAIRLGENFDRVLSEKLKAINLTTIASGVSMLGHRRARMKSKRDQFTMSANSQEGEAAKIITDKLILAQDAEDLSKPEHMFSMSDAEFRTKLESLSAAGMVMPVSLAVEINDRKASEMGKKLLEEDGHTKIPDFFNVAMPVGAAADDGSEHAAVDASEGYDWRSPLARLVPGTEASMCIRFESATFSYFVKPLFNAWGTSLSHDACEKLATDVDAFLIENTPHDAPEVIQASINKIIECMRAALYVQNPLNVANLSDFESLSSATALDDSGWKGILYNAFEQMGECSSFKAPLLSIRRTKVTHAVNVEKINMAVQILSSLSGDATDEQVTATRASMTDAVKNLTTLGAGSRDKSMRVLDEKLATFCGRVADQALAIETLWKSSVTYDAPKLTSTIDELKQISTFLEYASSGNLACMPLRCAAAPEACKDLSRHMSIELSKIGFAGRLTEISVTDFFDQAKKATFMDHLTAILRVADLGSPFPADVTTAAEELLQKLLEHITSDEAGMAGQKASEVLPVVGKVMELLHPSTPPRQGWITMHRLMTTAVDARTALLHYKSLGNDAASRVASDKSGVLLRGLFGAEKSVLAQSRQADDKYIDSVSMPTFHAAIDELIDCDSKAKYEAARAEVDKIWTMPMDPDDTASGSLKYCYQGTFDGSNWHDVISASADCDVISKHAARTILCLDPIRFKAAVSKFQKAFGGAQLEREGLDVKPLAQWEVEQAARIAKAVTTSREATMMAIFAKFKDNRNTLQSKVRLEKNAAEKSKPSSWEHVRASVKKCAEHAIKLLPL